MKNKGFIQKVYRVVSNIPKGKVLTYKDVARFAGNGNACRAVGMAMKKNKDTTRIPCHRVVASDGSMHGYSGGMGISTKRAMLKKEGVVFKGKKVNLAESRWNLSVK